MSDFGSGTDVGSLSLSVNNEQEFYDRADEGLKIWHANVTFNAAPTARLVTKTRSRRSEKTGGGCMSACLVRCLRPRWCRRCWVTRGKGVMEGQSGMSFPESPQLRRGSVVLVFGRVVGGCTSRVDEPPNINLEG